MLKSVERVRQKYTIYCTNIQIPEFIVGFTKIYLQCIQLNTQIRASLFWQKRYAHRSVCDFHCSQTGFYETRKMVCHHYLVETEMSGEKTNLMNTATHRNVCDCTCVCMCVCVCTVSAATQLDLWYHSNGQRE